MTLLDEAINELDWIERYLRKNWMDDEFPTDKLYEVLMALKTKQLASLPTGGTALC